jgi:hypothetical protein
VFSDSHLSGVSASRFARVLARIARDEFRTPTRPATTKLVRHTESID